MRKLIVGIILPALIVGCASTGNYERASSERGFGYSDTKLESDRYRVQYRLRGENVGKAQDYALLRAAELTMAEGDNWFRVVDRSSDVASGGRRSNEAEIGAQRSITRECGLLGCRTTSTPTYTAGATIGSFDDRGATIVVIEILTGAGRKPSGSNVYDAAEIAGNIRSRM